MDAKAILDGLLERSQRATQAGMQMAEERKVIPPAGDERTAMLKGAGAGALAAGAIALLFGSKGTRKFAKKAATFGGTAAIGGLAYKAYTEWQAQQAPVASQQISQQPGAPRESVSMQSATLNLDQFAIGTPINDLEAQQARRRSEVLIQAMISAARADGHVGDGEMTIITQQIENLGLEQDVTRFLLTEMNKPMDVQRIAALADTRETAAELYLASAMVIDVESDEERVYLDKLASALDLDTSLTRQLEAPLRS